MKSECRVADVTGERVHTMIMLARLFREAEESKKDERARDNQPVGYYEGVSHKWVILPNDAWDLDDL